MAKLKPTPTISIPCSLAGRQVVGYRWPRRQLFVWDLTADKVVAALDEGVMGFQTVAFAPDGKPLVTGGIDRKVSLWDFDRVLKDHRVK